MRCTGASFQFPIKGWCSLLTEIDLSLEARLSCCYKGFSIQSKLEFNVNNVVVLRFTAYLQKCV